jgi:lipoprotein-releasing system permease protein
MGPAISIAWRYFRGKKSAQAINIISWISIAAIAVSSAAMIILFSVFNGLEGTVKGMYAAFYPDIKITPVTGKFFQWSPEQSSALASIEGIQSYSPTLEDMVLLSSGEEQKVATLKGVSQQWFKISNLDTFMLEGKAGWPEQAAYTPAILGLGVSLALSVNIDNIFTGLRVYHPRSGALARLSAQPEAALNSILVKPEGIFGMQEEISGEYMLVPFEAAQKLLETGDRISAMEIKLQSADHEARVMQQLKKLLGPDLHVESRYEQNKMFYMIMHSEKWAVYAILLMVLLIASFNMIGSLSMVVIEKKLDIAVLKSMGAGSGLVRTVFLTMGLLLSLTGVAIGVFGGMLICLGQQYFGWIALPDGFIIEAYPVEMQWADFVLVIFTALSVGALAAVYPSLRASRQPVYVREE